MTSVWIGLLAAGAIGAPCRYLLDGWIRRRTEGPFPWGTFVVNATGSLALGLVTGAALYHALPSTPRIVLGTGFCGAYTTFGSWAFESVTLLERGEARAAALNVGMSLLVGAGASGVGLALAAAL